MTAGGTRTRPGAPDRPPPTHKPSAPGDAREHRRLSDKFAPDYEDERPMMTIRRPDGGVIPPAPKTAPPAERPTPSVGTPEDQAPTTNLRGPTPDEVLADPLVKTVLDVFEGEVKRIHPRPKRPNQ